MSDAVHAFKRADDPMQPESGSSERWHLQRAYMESFGSFSNRALGPFSPGMNVIFGKNESGKTTAASFIPGVLFGWRPARGRQNSYKPVQAERSGWLSFTDEEGNEARVHRTRNAEGLQGDAWLADDIDERTYRSLFSFNGDELRGLDDASTLTARLLTAGAGTDDSPAQIRAELDERLRTYTSRAAAHKHSLVNLSQAIDEADEQVAARAVEADDQLAAERELQMLQQQRDAQAEQVVSLNATVERLTAQKTQLENLEAQRDDRLAQRVDLRRSLDTAQRDTEAQKSQLPEETSQLRALDASQLRLLRDNVDELQEKRTRLERNLAAAQSDHTNAKSRYDALQEDDVFLKAMDHERHTRKMQGVMSIIVPLLSLAAGIPLTSYGLHIGSLTISAFGIALVVVALLMALAAVIALFRPSTSDDLVQQRRQDTHWMLAQDEKRVRACEKELADFDNGTESYLSHHGLAAAGPSLRRARTLLDTAHEERARLASLEQAEQSIRAQIDSENLAIASLQDQIDALLAESGAADDVELDRMAAEAASARDAAQAESEDMAQRIGQLGQQLSQARSSVDFNVAKQQAQNLRTQLEDSKREYARLLLARRFLETAIQEWERESQPAVYERASSLFSDMTGGAWRRIFLSPEGEIMVSDAEGRMRSPLLLSLGTCQQLYLSLRIALLMSAGEVGRNVPVIADDILANFDDDRRVPAARALLQLAQQRQVLLFTCQSAVADMISELDPTARIIRL
ncbi:MAG: ATP-binding protein [Eggerthellaceae bacterium]|jgi:uncharacterized protein YhaN